MTATATHSQRHLLGVRNGAGRRACRSGSATEIPLHSQKALLVSVTLDFQRLLLCSPYTRTSDILDACSGRGLRSLSPDGDLGQGAPFQAAIKLSHSASDAPHAGRTCSCAVPPICKESSLFDFSPVVRFADATHHHHSCCDCSFLHRGWLSPPQGVLAWEHLSALTDTRESDRTTFFVRGALLAKGPDSSFHMEEEKVEVEVQEDKVEDGRDK